MSIVNTSIDQSSASRQALELVSLAVLFGTTLLWGILGARLQAGNADQLVDSYLFEAAQTYNGASFPAQHTFLLKWPLFWLQSVFGLNSGSFIIMTLLIVLLTVAGLVYLVRRIEARPAVRSALYLALASVLLLTPPVPYAGALLPTNLAMLTTRNIEYLLYIAALIILAKDSLQPKRRFLIGSLGLGVLFVSDGLFPALAIGGALLLLILSVIQKRVEVRAFAQRWLGAAVVAYVAAAIVLRITNWFAPGTINGQVDPYRLVHSAHDFVLAIFYGFSALLTNFGANPGYSARTLHDIPNRVVQELGSVALFGYTINIALFGLAMYSGYQILNKTFFGKRSKHSIQSETVALATHLSLALLASTIVAMVSFVATEHYYVVDSRYLAIFMFTGIISIAVFMRAKTISGSQIRIVLIICSLAVASGCYSAVKTYHEAVQATLPYTQRNEKVEQELESHKVSVLVGDYWRVVPIKLASQNNQNVTPLADCTTPRDILTSTTWQPNLNTHSFAYLLTLDGSATNYPACSLDQIIKTYGTPTQSIVIAGSIATPRELLLFYDLGRVTDPQ